MKRNNLLKVVSMFLVLTMMVGMFGVFAVSAETSGAGGSSSVSGPDASAPTADIVTTPINRDMTTVPADETFDVWDGTTYDSVWEVVTVDDDNDPDTPEVATNAYYITSAAELAGLGKALTSTNKYKGFTFYVTVNIDLNGHTWTPIGAPAAPLQGSIVGCYGGKAAGCDHATTADAEDSVSDKAALCKCGQVYIKGLKTVSGNLFNGFIGVQQYGGIKNLTLVEPKMVDGTNTMGFFVGYVLPFTPSDVAESNHSEYVNLAVIDGEVVVTKSANFASVSDASFANSNAIGGIVGATVGTVSTLQTAFVNCAPEFTVITKKVTPVDPDGTPDTGDETEDITWFDIAGVGGIYGFTTKKPISSILNCDPSITVYTEGQMTNVAGIGSLFANCEIDFTDCDAKVDITCKFMAGQKVGGFVNDISCVCDFTNCTADGKITVTGGDATGIGGFTSDISAKANIVNCASGVDIDVSAGKATKIGGFAGTASVADELTLDGCSYKGTIALGHDSSYIGGMIGDVNGGARNFKNCEVDVKVDEPDATITYLGGVVGGNASGTVTCDGCNVKVDFTVGGSDNGSDASVTPDQAIAGMNADKAEGTAKKQVYIDCNAVGSINVVPFTVEGTPATDPDGTPNTGDETAAVPDVNYNPGAGVGGYSWYVHPNTGSTYTSSNASVNISAGAITGGLIGYVYQAGGSVTLTDVSVTNATIEAKEVNKGTVGMIVGGVIGWMRGTTYVYGCFVDNVDVIANCPKEATDASSCRYIGGFAGTNSNNGAKFDIWDPDADVENDEVRNYINVDVLVRSNGKAISEVGGFLGTANNPSGASYKAIDMVTTVTVKGGTATNVGGAIGSTATNIAVEDVSLKTVIDVSADSTQLGGFLGFCTGDATLNNVRVDVTMDEMYAVVKKFGGMCGGGNNSGGAPTFNNCYANLNLTLPGVGGGAEQLIAGIMAFKSSGDTKNVKYNNCVTAGNVTITGDAGSGYGGISGSAQFPTTFNNCASFVNFKFPETTNQNINAGGITGLTVANKDYTFNNCYFGGSIVAANGKRVGGFVGMGPGNLTFKNCHMDGTVSVPSTQNGGFIGRFDLANGNCATFENCLFTGTSKNSYDSASNGVSWIGTVANYNQVKYAGEYEVVGTPDWIQADDRSWTHVGNDDKLIEGIAPSANIGNNCKLIFNNCYSSYDMAFAPNNDEASGQKDTVKARYLTDTTYEIGGIEYLSQAVTVVIDGKDNHVNKDGTPIEATSGNEYVSYKPATIPTAVKDGVTSVKLADMKGFDFTGTDDTASVWVNDKNFKYPVLRYIYEGDQFWTSVNSRFATMDLSWFKTSQTGYDLKNDDEMAAHARFSYNPALLSDFSFTIRVDNITKVDTSLYAEGYLADKAPSLLTLTVNFQTKNVKVGKDKSSLSLRMISTVDALDGYDKGGFVVTINGGALINPPAEAQAAYTSILANKKPVTADELSINGKYIFTSTLDLTDMKNDTVITIQAYHVTMTGAVVYGARATGTLTDIINACK